MKSVRGKSRMSPNAARGNAQDAERQHQVQPGSGRRAGVRSDRVDRPAARLLACLPRRLPRLPPASPRHPLPGRGHIRHPHDAVLQRPSPRPRRGRRGPAGLRPLTVGAALALFLPVLGVVALVFILAQGVHSRGVLAPGVHTRN